MKQGKGGVWEGRTGNGGDRVRLVENLLELLIDFHLGEVQRLILANLS